MKKSHIGFCVGAVIATGYCATLIPRTVPVAELPNPTLAQHQDLTTFDGCGPEGTATKRDAYEENPLKNRFGATTVFDPTVTLETLLTAKVDAPLDQNKTVTIEGYLDSAKPGGKESTNCASTVDIDTHMRIVAHLGDDWKHGIVVEPTPRLRAQHPEWTQEYLQSLAGHKLKITGPLLNDKEHAQNSFNDNPNGTRNWRQSTWEIHPVTGIEDLGTE